MHDKIFMRVMQLTPCIHIVFASDRGLKILASSKWILIDGTFDLCEEKLILTTIMGVVNEKPIPCAYLLSDSKESSNYKKYMEVCTFRNATRKIYKN